MTYHHTGKHSSDSTSPPRADIRLRKPPLVPRLRFVSQRLTHGRPKSPTNGSSSVFRIPPRRFRQDTNYCTKSDARHDCNPSHRSESKIMEMTELVVLPRPSRGRGLDILDSPVRVMVLLGPALGVGFPKRLLQQCPPLEVWRGLLEPLPVVSLSELRS